MLRHEVSWIGLTLDLTQVDLTGSNGLLDPQGVCVEVA
jgi:hypothetical protein